MSKSYWTDALVKQMPPRDPNNADHIVWREGWDRFGIRFRNGVPSQFVMHYYGQDGRDHKHAIGKVKAISLTQAEALYKQKQGGLHQPVPVDPAIQRRQERAKHSDLFIDYVDPFLEQQKAHGISAKWLATQTLFLKGVDGPQGFRPAYFKALHQTPIQLITRSQIATEVDRVSKNHGLTTGNRARATLSKFFSFVLGRTDLLGNPVQHIERHPEGERERDLTPAELRIIWHAAGDDTEFGRIVRLLILTAARRSQIGELKKAWLKTKEAKISLPTKPGLRARKKAAKEGKSIERVLGGSKNNKPFDIHLSKQALAVLAKQPEREGSEFVFGDGGEGGFSGFSKCKAALDEKIADQITEPWTFHDFRRTFETLGQNVLKIPAHITDASMNHIPEVKKAGTGKNYRKGVTYWDERVEAMDRWGAYIEETVGTKPPRQLKLVAA